SQVGQGSLGSQSHTYADNGSYLVTVTVTDKDHESGSAQFTATVSNAKPAVTAPADQTASEGTSASFNLGSFTDAGANDNPWAVSVDWGALSRATTFSQTTQGSLGTANHTYADGAPTTYTVTVKVTDKDLGSASKTFKIIVANMPPVIPSL